MIHPLEITWRGVDPSPAVEAIVRQKVEALERFYAPLVFCHVAIESPHRRHRSGKRYRVRIDVTVPGAEIVVGHIGDANGAYEDLRVALRDAFRAARRRLQDHAALRRADYKAQVA